MRGRKLLAVLAVWMLCLTGCDMNIWQAGPALPEIGICARDLKDPVEAERVKELETRLLSAGYQVSILDAKGDQSVQTGQLEALVDRDCRGVILSPVMTTTAGELAAMVMASETPMVFVGTQPSLQVLEQWSRLSYVGTHPEQPGLMQGQLLLNMPQHADVNGDGVLSYILLQDDTGCNDTQLRTAGVLTALTEAEVALNELSRNCANGEKEAARESCALLLAEYGKDIEAVICNNDAMALGALEAIIDGGRTVGRDIYLVGIDGTDAALGKLRQGLLTGTVMEDIPTQADTTVKVLEQLINAQVTENTYYVNCIALTQEILNQLSQ